MTDKELLAFQRKSINLLEQRLEHHQRLYKLTKHSKKKAMHLANIIFVQSVILSTKDEYGW